MSRVSQELADDARHRTCGERPPAAAPPTSGHILSAAAGPQAAAATLGTATDWDAVVAAFRPQACRGTRCGGRPSAAGGPRHYDARDARTRGLRYDIGTSYRSPARAGILVFSRAGVVQWQNVSFPS
jgi:hypothetical protein